MCTHETTNKEETLTYSFLLHVMRNAFFTWANEGTIIAASFPSASILKHTAPRVSACCLWLLAVCHAQRILRRSQ